MDFLPVEEGGGGRHKPIFFLHWGREPLWSKKVIFGGLETPSKATSQSRSRLKLVLPY